MKPRSDAILVVCIVLLLGLMLFTGYVIGRDEAPLFELRDTSELDTCLDALAACRAP